MQYIRLFYIAILGLVIVSCGGKSKHSDEASKKKELAKVGLRELNSKPVKKVHDTVPNNDHVPQSETTTSFFKIDVVTCSYTKDNRKHNIKVHANIITFYFQNNEQDKVKKLRNAGFPMEFWSEGLCAFYPFKASDVKRQLKKAKQLGFEEYGYQCTVNDGTTSETGILGNTLRVKFNPITSNEDIAKILGPQLTYMKGFTHTIQVKVTDKSARSILNHYNRLKAHKDVESVEFSFETCDYRIPADEPITF